MSTIKIQDPNKPGDYRVIEKGDFDEKTMKVYREGPAPAKPVPPKPADGGGKDKPKKAHEA